MKNKTVICATLNGKPVYLVRKDGNYILRISKLNRGKFLMFGDAIRAIEKETGVAYPF